MECRLPNRCCVTQLPLPSLVTLLWLAALPPLGGCAPSGQSYQLHVLFPDHNAETHARSIELWALTPAKPDDCPELVDGRLVASQRKVSGRQRIDLRARSSAELPRVPLGEVLFFAEVDPPLDQQVLRGCARATVETDHDREVTIALYWICAATDGGACLDGGRADATPPDAIADSAAADLTRIDSAPDAGHVDIDTVDSAQPDAVTDAGQDGATTLDAARPEAATDIAAVPDTAQPDSIRPDTNRPDTNRPDVVTDAGGADTAPPDTGRPDTAGTDLACVAGPDWTITTAEREDQETFGAISLAVELRLNGQPHLAYLRGGESSVLRYATLSESGWRTDTVDSVNLEYATPTVRVDGQGFVHIGYVRLKLAEAELVYAHGSLGDWTLEVVPDTDHPWISTDMVLSSSGSPNFCYVAQSAATDTLTHVYRYQESWLHDPIGGSEELMPDHCKIVLGSISAPRIAYFNSYDASLGYYYLQIGLHYSFWSQSPLASGGLLFGPDGWAIDSGGGLHATWSNAIDNDLRYASSADSWNEQIILPGEQKGLSSSMDLDGDNLVHIAHWDQLGQNLLYTTNTSGVWHTEPVACDGEVGPETAIGVGIDGTVFIAFPDANRSAIKLAIRSP